MSKSFEQLAAETKAGWSSDAKAVYDAAAASFTADLDVRAELGAQLAAARRERHLTQGELSAVTGVQQAEISRIERGLANPTEASLTRLASALGHRLVLQPLGTPS